MMNAKSAWLVCTALLLGGCNSNSSNTQSYSLNGTVSGLSTNGLVLSVDGANVSVAGGTTSVPLASGLAAGTAYTVTVQTQPGGQMCTVASGAGTIGTANVSNVVVTCADQAYALGGSIAGLNGPGLVLANGSDTLSVPANAATFTMPTQVAYTSSYDVKVLTQPAGLACAVTQGSGTMPASTVTNVMVNCTDQPFSVGGTILGLGQNTGLVLVNGSDSLTVSAGATSFTMPTQVAFGSTYNVTTNSSPTGLTCTVMNGGGTMGAANVTNIAVTCSDRSFALGGTITGLTQGGLVLTDGSSALLVIPGSTTFTMNDPVAFTSPYNVQVQTQPTGETCSVSNGSGSMPANAVTNVAVNCSLVTYTIGGSITGLTGTGLVLLDNNGDPVAIAANATQYSMPSGIAYGGNYVITAQTAPAGTACGIANSVGFYVTADVANVNITCGPSSALYAFSDAGLDGVRPAASLILGNDGNFYGTASTGGTGAGVVFKLTPAGVETVLYTFTGSPGSSSSDGFNPLAAVIQASDGNFYGTTEMGGANGLGTVFKVTPAGAETLLYSFGASGDGSSPYAGLAQGSDGNFYGTTQLGGANAAGTVFKITPAGVETVLYSFGATGSDGTRPYAGLVQGSDGNFYGTTQFGGTNALGTVFEITPAGVETVLYSFGTVVGDGAYPQGGLIQASDGNFYGTTGAGVFKITPAGVLTVLYTFTTGDGYDPTAGVIQGSDGNFYGTTQLGGANQDGTVFKVTPAGVETIVYSFGATSYDGIYPVGGVIRGSDGSLYGMTGAGGPADHGTVFKVGP
jgi:uncharacterized repeat protein (TIGR03803 family)